MTKPSHGEPIKECGSCRTFQASTPQHLCVEGKCYRDRLKPVPKKRYESCEHFESLTEGITEFERGLDGHN